MVYVRSVKWSMVRGDWQRPLYVIGPNINMGDVTAEAGSLLHRLSTLTEKADTLLCRWLLRKATLQCCPLRLPLTDAEKTASSPCSLIVDRI